MEGLEIRKSKEEENGFAEFGFMKKENRGKNNGKSAGIILVLSKYNARSILQDYTPQNEEENIYKGIQTNDAPVQYLIDEAFISGYDLKRVLCITTHEVETPNKEGICALERFTDLVKTYVRSVWETDIDVQNISYREGTEEGKKYYNFYKDLNEKTEGLNSAYVDYTGGLRDTSFLMVVAIRFLEYKGIKCEKVIYSDYFSEKKQLKDLKEIYGLFQMINGMNQFLESGTTRQLDDLFDAENTFINAIRQFSHATNVGDIENLDTYIRQLNRAMNEMSVQDDLKTLMVNSMREVMKTKLFGTDGGNKLIDDEDNIDYYRLIEWCIDNKMYQQATVLYIEKVPVVYRRDNIITELVELSKENARGSSEEADTFYRILPEWLVSDPSEEELKKLLESVTVPIEKDWNCNAFLNRLKTILLNYPKAFNRIQKIIKYTYSGYKKCPGKEFTPLTVYGDDVRISDIAKFMKQSCSDKKFIHYYLYDDRADFEYNTAKDKKDDPARDKIRSQRQIEKIYKNADNSPKTNDDKSLGMMLAYYLAIKILRNKMSHAAENAEGGEGIVINRLEAFFKENAPDCNIKISLKEEDIRGLLNEALKYSKSVKPFKKYVSTRMITEPESTEDVSRATSKPEDAEDVSRKINEPEKTEDVSREISEPESIEVVSWSDVEISEITAQENVDMDKLAELIKKVIVVFQTEQFSENKATWKHIIDLMENKYMWSIPSKRELNTTNKQRSPLALLIAACPSCFSREDNPEDGGAPLLVYLKA